MRRLKQRPLLRQIFLALAMTCTLSTALLQAQPAESVAVSKIAVVYPRVREPFRSVFQSIADGAEREAPGRVETIEVDADSNTVNIVEMLEQQQIDAAILLGKRGLDISSAMSPNTRKVVGAVFASPTSLPSDVSGISLAPAPDLLFAKVHELAPSVERVTVVHGDDDNAWLVELGRAAAQASGLQFRSVAATTLRDAANAYRDILQEGRSDKDAVWLLQASSFLNENSLLQMILREAWNRNLVVFSSNPSHVPKGALFSLFPDNAALGEELARLAISSGNDQQALRPVRSLKTALNIRTADHLGLGLNEDRDGFDMVFPNR